MQGTTANKQQTKTKLGTIVLNGTDPNFPILWAICRREKMGALVGTKM